MRRYLVPLCALLSPILVTASASAGPAPHPPSPFPTNTTSYESTASSIPLNISSLFNNRGFAASPGDADFDGMHSGYPAEFLPSEEFTYAGVNFSFPQYRASGPDNLLAQGQTLYPQSGTGENRFFSVHMLAAAETAVATSSIHATYADNSTSSAAVLVDPWWAWPYPYGGDIVFPYYLRNDSVDYNRSMIFYTVSWLDSSKELVSLQLPNVTAGASSSPGGAVQDTRLHVFAVSLVPAAGSAYEHVVGSGEEMIRLEVQQARTTNMWIEGTNKTQIVQVVINNVGEEWVLAEHHIKVTVEAPGLRTVKAGYLHRLRPGDQAKVEVGAVNTNGTAIGTIGPATVEISGVGVRARSAFNATYGITAYEDSFESIYSHESPSWYNNAKYGIFIHWGVYSVPGWGNVGKNEAYAEWYWWYMNQGPGHEKPGAYEYNLATYGPSHAYDSFIQNFSTSAFDPHAWVDLFAAAGANYFVQTTKHHDGYALFDIPTNISNRNSVAQFPHKNLLQMLFEAADTYQPQLHKGTYFSLPEWFHPDYKKYGFGDWPGGNATNPYTNETLPYTGYVPVEDFVLDLILPEMRILSEMGTEIMWCDIGGPNLTTRFAEEFYNNAAAEGRQVTMNSRCGHPGDFDTPEYARYDAAQLRKWESNLGMDPYSYGYNRATPSSAYLAPAEVVTSLVDIVSKNGNFLLDIGPTANGTIIEVEQQNLRAAGRWIHDHAEAIFNTTFWFVTPQEGETVRFTQTLEAFYILTLYAPNATLVLDSPVPYVPGDEVVIVGGNMSGAVVPSLLLSNGSLELKVTDEVRDADEYSWVFKIPYRKSHPIMALG